MTLTPTDPRGPPKPVWRWLERALDGMLRDERDAVLVQDALARSVFIALGLLLFVPGVFSWPVGILYLALLIPNIGPTAVLLHMVVHRSLFEKRWRVLDAYVPWVLALFFGMDPGGYLSHHVGMHHVEENMPPDRSATLRYRRDSLWHFCLYWWRFQLIGKLELFAYLAEKRRFKLFRRLLYGEIVHKGVLLLALYVNLPAALVVFVLPHLIARWGLMMGNWSQHAFIDPAAPADPYANSVTLINCPYNVKMYNDGYHCGHHVRATEHWAEAPGGFEAALGRYAERKAVVFDGIRGFQVMWWLLMRRRYDVLARHLVTWPGGPSSIEERIAFLEARTAPIPAPPPGNATAW